MKKVLFMLTLTVIAISGSSQPRPYEIDDSFIPTMDYMQKISTGSYDGLEPNSKIILSISRSLTLNSDFSYINKVTGHINQDGKEVLYRYETGTYQYDQDTRMLKYIVYTDSTLDISSYLQGAGLNYTANHYTDANFKTATEVVQFTPASNDSERLWVLFDPQLMSSIDPRQKAVYVMQGKAIENAIIVPKHEERITQYNSSYYNLNGVPTQHPINGVYIVNGKKLLVRK